MSGVRFSIKWRGSRKMKKELDKLRRQIPEAVLAAAVAEAREILEVAKQRVPKWSGGLAESGFIEARGLNITLGFEGPHAWAHHEGWPSGAFPSPEALKPWAEAVLGDAGAAYPVARNIAEGGFQGQPRKYLENPIKERLPGMANRIARRARGML